MCNGLRAWSIPFNSNLFSFLTATQLSSYFISAFSLLLRYFSNSIVSFHSSLLSKHWVTVKLCVYMCELPQWRSSILVNPNTTSEGEALRMWLHERERRASGEETTSEKKKKRKKKKHRTPPHVSAHAELQENAKKCACVYANACSACLYSSASKHNLSIMASTGLADALNHIIRIFTVFLEGVKEERMSIMHKLRTLSFTAG